MRRKTVRWGGQPQNKFRSPILRRTKAPQPDTLTPRDPRLSYKKANLVVRLRKAEERLKAVLQKRN
jgi:hypothetical protein